MIQIILDTNIILDYFIEDRLYHQQVREILNKNKNKAKYLITSHQYDTETLQNFVKILYLMLISIKN